MKLVNIEFSKIFQVPEKRSKPRRLKNADLTRCTYYYQGNCHLNYRINNTKYENKKNALDKFFPILYITS